MSGPVTLDAMRRQNHLIEITCQAQLPRTNTQLRQPFCCHRVSIDPHKLPFPDTLPVPAIADRMKCSVCGHKNSPGYRFISTRGSGLPAPPARDGDNPWLFFEDG